MKSYKDLSNAGKLRRLHGLAASALAHYDLHNPELTYHTFATNLLYRVTLPGRERFMLRLAYPGWRTLQDLQSEAIWLDALARDTALPVPRIVPALTGEQVLPLTFPGVPDAWNGSAEEYFRLMSWVPGRLLGKYLTPRNLEKMGALFAQLHQHGAAWQPPDGFTTHRFEHWLSRREENRITGDKLPPASPIQAVPSPARQLLERIHQHVETAYAALDRSDLRVIHCDLWHENIKLYQNALHPLDFEDTVWGFRAHDIAMAMLDLLETVGEGAYPRLLAAFRHGYEANLAWPGNPLEPFQVGRLLWKINWVARFQSEWLSNMVERHIPVFEHYERTGQVILPPVKSS